MPDQKPVTISIDRSNGQEPETTHQFELHVGEELKLATDYGEIGRLTLQDFNGQPALAFTPTPTIDNVGAWPARLTITHPASGTRYDAGTFDIDEHRQVDNGTGGGGEISIDVDGQPWGALMVDDNEGTPSAELGAYSPVFDQWAPENPLIGPITDPSSGPTNNP